MASKKRIDQITGPPKKRSDRMYWVGFGEETTVQCVQAKSHKAAAREASENRVKWAMVSDLPIEHRLRVKTPHAVGWKHFTINHELKSK